MHILFLILTFYRNLCNYFSLFAFWRTAPCICRYAVLFTVAKNQETAIIGKCGHLNEFPAGQKLRPDRREGVMHADRKRISMPFLCFICVMITGMCLGTIPADSFLASSDLPSRSCSIRSGSKTSASTQAFEHNSFGQCDTALTPRQAMRRNSARTIRHFCPVPLAADIFSPMAALTAYGCSHGFFREAASHTAIINYIHRQDGQKPLSPL